MSKKKDKEQTVKKVIEEVKRNGRCLKCGKPMVKNHKACGNCKKKKRLMKKANQRGYPKNHYL